MGWWGAGLWAGLAAAGWTTWLAAVCCKKLVGAQRRRLEAEGRRSEPTQPTQPQPSLADEPPVRPRQPETPAQAARSREIRAGRQARRKDPAYKTLAEIKSDWSSTGSAEGPRLEPTTTDAAADPVAAAIRAGKRLKRRDPEGDSFRGIPSDWESSGREPDPAGTRDTGPTGGTPDNDAAKPPEPKPVATKPAPKPAAPTGPTPGPSRDPQDVHSAFLT